MEPKNRLNITGGVAGAEADVAGAKHIQIHIHNSTIGAVAAAGDSASSLGAVTNPLPLSPPPPVHPGSPDPVRRSRVTSGRAVIMAVGAVMTVSFIAMFVKSAATSAGAAKSADIVRASDASASLASFARIQTRMTPKQVADITGLAVSVGPSGWMKIPLAEDAPFTDVLFAWNEEQTHIRAIDLEGLREPSRASVIRERLQEHLGRRFIDSIFQWQGCALTLQGNLLTASAHAEWAGGPNPQWENQIETLWDVVRADALGLAVPVIPAAVTHWLGRGYPLKAVGGIDPKVEIERSDDAIVRLFPGAYTHEGAEHERTRFVALDHRWFGEARFRWKNEPGGKLVSVTLRLPPGKERFEDQGAIDQCLRGALGAPQERAPGDRLQDKFSDTWARRSGSRVILGPSEIDISQQAGKPLPKSLLQTVISKLDACAR